MDYVHIIDSDDVNYDRYGRVKDQNGDPVLYLIQFYDGESEPRAWFFADQFEYVESIPPGALKPPPA